VLISFVTLEAALSSKQPVLAAILNLAVLTTLILKYVMTINIDTMIAIKKQYALVNFFLGRLILLVKVIFSLVCTTFR
jgi:hypothetical protein